MAGTAITVITVIEIFSGDSLCVLLLETLLEKHSNFKYFHWFYSAILCLERRQSQFRYKLFTIGIINTYCLGFANGHAINMLTIVGHSDIRSKFKCGEY